MKRFLFQGVIGLFFGAFLMVFLTCATVLMGQETINGHLFMKNALGFIFCGWLFAVTPLFFEIQSLRLMQQTALHFITAMCPYLILSFSIGWIPFDAKSIVSTAFIFLLIYAAIWLGFYLYFKRQASRMNDQLNKL